jgi:hypothetical protein
MISKVGSINFSYFILLLCILVMESPCRMTQVLRLYSTFINLHSFFSVENDCLCLSAVRFESNCKLCCIENNSLQIVLSSHNLNWTNPIAIPLTNANLYYIVLEDVGTPVSVEFRGILFVESSCQQKPLLRWST